MSALISNQKPANLVISNAFWRAEIQPIGASLVSLDYQGSQIAVTPFSPNFYPFAGDVLAPWPNRLDRGTWTFSGKILQGKINDDLGQNANHGLVFDRQFAVVSHDQEEVSLAIDLGSDDVYPFRLNLEVRYRLTSDGLVQSFEATNFEAQPIPFAYGAHPYLLLDEDSKVEINAREIYVQSARNLPIGKMAIGESDFVKQGMNRVTNLKLDHCFTSLVADGDTRFSTRITRPKIKKIVQVWQDQQFDHLMLFVFKEPNIAGRITLAVEPQTAPANALRSYESIDWLNPGEKFDASWGIAITEGLIDE